MNERPMHQPGNFEKLEAIYAQGETHLSAGQLEEAVAKFSEGLAIDDHFRQRYITMYSQRAFALHRLGRWEEAISDYTRALELEAELLHGQNYFHRGMCLMKLEGRQADAEADLTRAIAANPSEPGPYHMRAKLRDEAGRFEEAIADWTALIERRPHPEAFQLRGFAKIQLHDFEAGLADVLQSLELRADPYSDCLAACALGALGRLEEMCAHAGRSVEVGGQEYRELLESAEELAPHREHPGLRAILGPGS
jgi:tetratricopeptide (TPR) repeat protein